MRESMRQLDEGSRMLRDDVKGLTDTLHLLQDVQDKQRLAELENIKTRAKVTEIQRETQERGNRLRRSIGMVGLALAILLPLVSTLVYISLIEHVDNLLSQQRTDRIAACQARNAGTQGNIAREEQLAILDENPAVQKAHRDSVIALRGSLLNCNTGKPAGP